MQALAAVSSMAVAVGLVLARPRIGRLGRVGPAAAAGVGVLLMAVSGGIGAEDIGDAAGDLWQPLVTVGSIMVIAASALRLGVLDRLAAATLPAARGSTARLFASVFVLSAATSAVLNNDAAVLLLTPLVVLLIRRLYGEDGPVVPFAFAVFMAAGVAPLVVSNPMNMIVADYADIGFNSYAVRMMPISVAGWIVAYLVLRRLVRAELDAAGPPMVVESALEPWTLGQKLALALFVSVLLAYPVVSYLGGAIWVVAATGAAFAVLLAARHGDVRATRFVREGVSWDTLAFLFGVFVMALGLRNAGVVDELSSLYEHSSVAVVGAVSAVGSAVVNNHPMALINLLALEGAPGVGEHHILAALIGGDLGPRLLPIGSLAGLLWLGALRAQGVDVSLTRFFITGAAVTIPSLVISLLLLAVM